MRRLFLGLCVFLGACAGVELLGPEDPAYEDTCMFWLPEDPNGSITIYVERSIMQTALDSCEGLHFTVVRFGQ